MHKPIRYKQMFGKRYRKHRSWDLFSYLAKDIANDLRAFMLYNINSVPQEFVPNIDKIKAGEDCEDLTEIGMKYWHETVEEMWWSFNEIANDHPNSPYNIAWNKYWKEIGQYRKLEDWTYEKDGHTYYNPDDKFILPPKKDMDEYNDKVQKGLHLFATYFENLWD